MSPPSKQFADQSRRPDDEPARPMLASMTARKSAPSVNPNPNHAPGYESSSDSSVDDDRDNNDDDEIENEVETEADDDEDDDHTSEVIDLTSSPAPSESDSDSESDTKSKTNSNGPDSKKLKDKETPTEIEIHPLLVLTGAELARRPYVIDDAMEAAINCAPVEQLRAVVTKACFKSEEIKNVMELMVLPLLLVHGSPKTLGLDENGDELEDKRRKRQRSFDPCSECGADIEEERSRCCKKRKRSRLIRYPLLGDLGGFESDLSNAEDETGKEICDNCGEVASVEDGGCCSWKYYN